MQALSVVAANKIVSVFIFIISIRFHSFVYTSELFVSAFNSASIRMQLARDNDVFPAYFHCEGRRERKVFKSAEQKGVMENKRIRHTTPHKMNLIPENEQSIDVEA